MDLNLEPLTIVRQLKQHKHALKSAARASENYPAINQWLKMRGLQAFYFKDVTAIVTLAEMVHQ